MVYNTLNGSIPETIKKHIKVFDDCWVWQGSFVRGYGKLMYEKERWLAHRLIKTLAIGKQIPSNMVCDHLCRNKACVNPDHIRIVTQKENIHAEGSLAVAKKRSELKCCSKCGGNYTVYKPKWLKGKSVRRCQPCDSKYKREWERKKCTTL